MQWESLFYYTQKKINYMQTLYKLIIVYYWMMTEMFYNFYNL